METCICDYILINMRLNKLVLSQYIASPYTTENIKLF